MRALAILVLLVACGGPAASPAAPAGKPPAAAPASADDNVEDVATRLGRAAVANDRPTALALTLTYTEVAKLSAKAAERDAAEWDTAVTEFFDQIAKEGADGKLLVTGAKLVKTDKLTPAKDEKITREIELAVVQLVIAQDGRPAEPGGPPLLFLKTDVGWRFSPKN